jgi:hypothetical protein
VQFLLCGFALGIGKLHFLLHHLNAARRGFAQFLKQISDATGIAKIELGREIAELSNL